MTSDQCDVRESEQLADWIRMACLLEASAPKPGNVHPGAASADLTFADFVRSAEVVSPILARSRELGVGYAICDAVCRTHEVVGKNTNLGIILLLAPLAAVPTGTPLRRGISSVLSHLTQIDAQWAYQAIRTAAPGSMGTVPQQDVSQRPSVTLLDAMRLAVDRDGVARQYATDFHDVFSVGIPLISGFKQFSHRWQEAVVCVHLNLMRTFPDSLIARKCGVDEARHSAKLAGKVLDAGWPERSDGHECLKDLDAWLRAKGNQRNPGTTADIVTALSFCSAS